MVFVAGHFGEWIQGRIGPKGDVGLITLATPDYGVRINATTSGPFVMTSSTKQLLKKMISPNTAQSFLHQLGLIPKGQYDISSDFSLGNGTGVSTALLVALAYRAGFTQTTPSCEHHPQNTASNMRLKEQLFLARACINTEGASDPLMLSAPDQVLWASRKAKIIKQLSRVAKCEILGGFFGPAQQTNPLDNNFPDISDLVQSWVKAAQDDTLNTPTALMEYARLASMCFDRTTKLRGPANDPTPALAQKLGALGYARAHTGSARALIFHPGGIPKGAKAIALSMGLRHVLSFKTGG